MSLYSYYDVKSFPNNKNVPKDYIEINVYSSKTYIDDKIGWAYGEVGYNRLLSEMEEQAYGLLRK